MLALELLNNLPISIECRKLLSEEITRLHEKDQRFPHYFEEEDEHGRSRNFIMYRKQAFLNALTLFSRILNEEKANFLIENAERLTEYSFYHLLNSCTIYHYPEHCQELELFWNALFRENGDKLIKIIRFVYTFRHHGPTVLNILLLPENQDFLLGAHSYINTNNLFSILSSSDSFSPTRIQNSIDLIRLHPGENLRDFFTQDDEVNARYNVYLRHIIKYLKNIGFIDGVHHLEKEVLEHLVDPDHTNLITLQIDKKPLCHWLSKIPGEIFIRNKLWAKLLQCAATSSQDNQNSVEIFKAFFNEVAEMQKNSIDNNFIQLQTALEETLDELREQSNNTQNYSQFFNEKQNTAEIYLLLSAVKDKNVENILKWLSENRTILFSKSFRTLLEKKLNNLKPFGITELDTLEESIQLYTDIIYDSQKSQTSMKTGMG